MLLIYDSCVKDRKFCDFKKQQTFCRTQSDHTTLLKWTSIVIIQALKHNICSNASQPTSNLMLLSHLSLQLIVFWLNDLFLNSPTSFVPIHSGVFSSILSFVHDSKTNKLKKKNQLFSSLFRWNKHNKHFLPTIDELSDTHQYSSPPAMHFSYTGPSNSRWDGKMASWWMIIVLMTSLTWAWQDTGSWSSGIGISVGPKQMARL